MFSHHHGHECEGIPQRLGTQDYIEKDYSYCAHNFKPLPVVLTRGEGIYVWDVDGRRYLDFLCGYSSNNQGHSHPKILKAFIEQALKITQTSRAFHHDQMGLTCEYLTKLLGYDKFLPMNSGAEAAETSVKIARRWGYVTKGIPHNQAKVVMMQGNFWGRTITASGACDDPSRYTNFGPFTPGFPLVPFNNIGAIKELFESDPTICAIFLEPILGERGVIIPDKGYLTEIKKLCRKHNVLMCLDEIQTGLGRTGKLMAYEWDEDAKPDIMAVGKALAGGLMPVSGAFCDDHIMMNIKPGDHGSTFGGNPLAMATARAAIKTLVEEGMPENAKHMGEILGEELRKIKSPLIADTRCRGLFSAVEVARDSRVDGHDLAKIVMKLGLLTKATHDYNLRLAPALIITEDEVLEAAQIVKEGVKVLEQLHKERANK
jgi:ornithine--oxo-acid transaminase